MQKTADGYSWTNDTGTRKGGLKCRGVVHPTKKLQTSAQHHYDVIVVGAGYAGLAAARDLATSSTNVRPWVVIAHTDN